MNDVEGAAPGLDDLFQEIVALEKQVTTLREKQTPHAVDVVALLQQYIPAKRLETDL